ncbi:hypothetical protein GCM10020254_69950 [Streptomyces goshikiensis]
MRRALRTGAGGEGTGPARPPCATIEILPGLGHDVLKESSGVLRKSLLAHLEATAAAAATGTGTGTGTGALVR